MQGLFLLVYYLSRNKIHKVKDLAAQDFPVHSDGNKFVIIQFMNNFYQRNLFERVIIYIFVSALIVKIYFELILGQWSFLQAQNKQWIFYILLALDYIISSRKVIAIRIRLNIMSLYGLFVILMVLHGLFVGLMNRNETFVIFNDLVPLLMIALNILRFQSLSEYKPIDYPFLLKACTILSIGTCAFGLIAVLLGKPSAPTVGNGTIYLPLILSAVFCMRPFPKLTALCAFIMITLSISELNRTTLLFFVGAIGIYSTHLLVKKPALGLSVFILLLMLVTCAWISLPETSGTYRRIVGLYDVDLDKRTGSIGERQAEMDAVQAKLDGIGPSAQWLGLGFGGVYEVQFTHSMLTNYGHAHYSWVWHNLRFGRLGYMYLLVMVCVLIYQSWLGFSKNDPLGVFMGLLCFYCLVFCLTYVNAIFLLSGIPFFYRLYTTDG